MISGVIARSVGVSYPAINASELIRLKIPIPPLPEQQTIAAFLDSETAKIDDMIQAVVGQGFGQTADEKSLVGLLKERRSALISAAVTGKIDVRNSDRSDKSDLSESSCQTDLSEGFSPTDSSEGRQTL